MCDPGATQACACVDNRTGAQECEDTGARWGDCVCAGGEGEGEGEGETGFQGGSFTVTIDTVDDTCFDQAMKTLIGPPSVLPAPIVLPGMSALPTQLAKIDFNDPFQDVENVDIEANGDHGIKTTAPGFTNAGIDLFPDDADNECLVDMTITATITIVDDNTITGEATLNVTAATGEGCTDDFTAAVAADGGCNIAVTMSGATG